MKKWLLLSFILVGISGFSQSEMDTFNHEFDVRVSGFIDKYLNLGGNSGVDFSNYDFYYTNRVKESLYMRFGLGTGFFKNKESTSGAELDRIDSSIDLDISFGLLWRSHISPRWEPYWGLELRAGYDQRVSESMDFGPFKSTVTTLGGGLAPILGMRFYISDRFSLSTESNLYLGYTEQKRKNEFNNNQSNEDKSTSLFVNTELPFSVVLKVKF